MGDLASTQEGLDRLAAEEERLQFDRFDRTAALDLGLGMLDVARREQLPLVISVRHGHHRIFHAALPGTSTDNDDWIDRKTSVVERFGHSSYYVGTLFRIRNDDFTTVSRLDRARFAADGGAFPILVRGVGPVGTVAVSGLPQDEDHAFVVAQLEAFLNR